MDAGGRLSGPRLASTGTDGMGDAGGGGTDQAEEAPLDQAGDRGSDAAFRSQDFAFGGDSGSAVAGRVSGSLDRRSRLAAGAVCGRGGVGKCRSKERLEVLFAALAHEQKNRLLRFLSFCTRKAFPFTRIQDTKQKLPKLVLAHHMSESVLYVIETLSASL